MSKSMQLCPATTLDDLKDRAFKYIRCGVPPWGEGQIVRVARAQLKEMNTLRLELGADTYTRVLTPKLTFRVGLGCAVLIPSEWRATHFHGDLQHDTLKLHIDYFKFMSWGPLCGVEGFIISLDGSVLGVGGHWGGPPAGGSRNWPLGLLIGSRLLRLQPLAARSRELPSPREMARRRRDGMVDLTEI